MILTGQEKCPYNLFTKILVYAILVKTSILQKGGSMKKIYIKILNCFLMFVVCISFASCFTSKTVEYSELGIPLSERYSQGVRARCPWDMYIWDGKIYIGSGDYDSNAGPVDIWAYDTENKAWENTGTVPDEEVSRFLVIDGKLTVPGIDPKDDWIFGNYYVLENGEWCTIRTISGGLHNFDMVEYQGMIFAGLGVYSGEYPIVCSRDGGKTFTPIEMQKDGKAFDTSGSEVVRISDLFVFDGNLYAAFRYGDTEITYDLYKYESGVFVYDNQLYQKIHQIKFFNSIIASKTEFKCNMFFTTGYLYATSDMSDFTRVVFPNSEIVYDLYVKDDILYALCGVKQSDGKYKVSVWKNSSGQTLAFSEAFNFVYDVPPMSMVYDGDTFYIGMGDSSSNNNKNGMIISVNN